MHRIRLAVGLALGMMAIPALAEAVNEVRIDPISVQTAPPHASSSIFAECDTDGDGLVTRLELDQWLEVIFGRAQDRAKWGFASMLLVLDTPIRSEITVSERKRLIERFLRRADADGDRAISDEELKIYAKSIGLPPELLGYARGMIDAFEKWQGWKVDPAGPREVSERILNHEDDFGPNGYVGRVGINSATKLWDILAVNGVVKLDAAGADDPDGNPAGKRSTNYTLPLSSMTPPVGSAGTSTPASALPPTVTPSVPK